MYILQLCLLQLLTAHTLLHLGISFTCQHMRFSELCMLVLLRVMTLLQMSMHFKQLLMRVQQLRMGCVLLPLRLARLHLQRTRGQRDLCVRQRSHGGVLTLDDGASLGQLGPQSPTRFARPVRPRACGLP
jgi:hypothetical protein